MSEIAHICEACDKRQRVCAGPCICTISKKDVFEHYSGVPCPLDKFTPEAIEAAKVGQPKPIPYEQWDQVYKDIAAQRIDGEAGCGDTLARLIKEDPKTVKVYELLTGKAYEPDTCGCEAERQRLNRLYKYEMDQLG